MDFVKELITIAKKSGINIDEQKAQKLEKFAWLLTEENKSYNLTAITQPLDIIEKHFIDSLKGLRFIKNANKIVDIGSGAGFPSIPLKVVAGKGEYLLLDSLNKRIGFLNKVVQKIELNEIVTIHSRIEDAAREKDYRHKFDIVLARAVSPLNSLLEYAMPFLKEGGRLIAYKGKKAYQEIEEAKNALKTMRAEVDEIYNYTIGNEQRYIVALKSLSESHKGYPREKNKPRRQPL